MPKKRLVVCLDGTWNRADDKEHSTNVVALMRAIAPRGPDGTEQVVFYDKGVGTGGIVDRLKGGMTGSGLGTNVRDAYIFLGNNYRPPEGPDDPDDGDEIYIFGFSRGAFTARSLAGFITAAGLLDRWSLRDLGKAWAYYRTPPKKRDPKVRAELDSFPATIKCLGVWDTVGALGVPLRWFNPFHWTQARHRFHDTQLSPLVKRAFHALAIDEKRGPFAPTLWQRPTHAEPHDDQVVEQVWFSGAHSDVGGGYGRSDRAGREGGLSPLTLHWMISRVMQTTGLAFDPKWEEMTHSGDPLGPMHESRSLPYLVSRILPYERVVGGRAEWTRRFLPSRNMPEPGNVFTNEAVHPSVLARFGREVETIDGRRVHRAVYRPKSLVAAEGHVPVAGVQQVPVETRVSETATVPHPGP